MKRLRIGKVLTAGIISGVVMFASAGTASADENYSQSAQFDHSFKAADGSSVTCSVAGSSELSRATGVSAFTANAETDTFGDPGVCDATVSITMTYRDPQNADQSASASDGASNSVTLTRDDVGSGYSAKQSVRFSNCSAGCTVTFVTAPYVSSSK